MKFFYPIVLVLVFATFLLLHKFPFTATPLQSTDASTAKSNAASNSATGTLFTGKVFRRYLGPVLFSHFTQPIKHFKSKNESNQTCSNWGVVTTINSVTPAVEKVANSANWCLVIVADLKTPSDYLKNLPNKPNIFFLSCNAQEKYASNSSPFATFVKQTPYNSFARKNIGYLYVIQQNPSTRYIFDFDDDNIIKPKMQLIGTEKNIVVDIATSQSLALNPYVFMDTSIPNSWPRGYPLEQLQSSNDSILSRNASISMHTIGVMQFCADENPDIDAVHRLVKPLPMYFGSKQGLAVSSNVFAPYNAQATIHTNQVFWALLLPATVPGRVSDIWRSYFAQCIFHHLGLDLVFLPPKVDQVRNAHNYLADMQAEEDLYYKTGQLLTFLDAWKTSSNSLPSQMELLWIELYERGYIEEDDVMLMQSWLQTLVDFGYRFPTLKNK